MRISSQNNQFIFNLPEDFISRRLEEQFQKLLDKNFSQYTDSMSYINSTIKDVVFPSVSYEIAEQKMYHGKQIRWREAGNVMDKFQGEIDVTFRSVDSHLNYFMVLQALNDYYLNKETYLPLLNIKVLDKDGDLIYNVNLKDVIYKSISELRMAYYATTFDENTFTVQFAYNYIDIIWQLEDDLGNGKSIFDVPVIEPNPFDSRKIEEAHKQQLIQSSKLIK